MNKIKLRPHNPNYWEWLYSIGKSNEFELSSKDCSGMDLSNYDLADLSFDDKTIWPTDPSKLPKRFQYKNEVVELGKNPGLGVHQLHTRGIDGNGMRMAIIESTRLCSHKQYDENLVHYEEFGFDDNINFGDMHATTVASIATGKTVGVAPKAQLYFFATNSFFDGSKERKPPIADNVAAALERIIEINSTLPDNEKIQVVSMSWGGQMQPQTPGHEKWVIALEKAKKAGLFVLTTSSNQENGLRFVGTACDMLQDPDLSSGRQAPRWWCNDILKREQENPQGKIMPPMDHRTVASPVSENSYTHYGNKTTGMSWATPWLAGMFVLARQVDPTVTPEHFWEVALKTGVLNKEVGGSIIQPVKLIETLEKERTQALGKQKGKTDAPKKRTKTKGLPAFQKAVILQNQKLAERKGIKK